MSILDFEITLEQIASFIRPLFVVIIGFPIIYWLSKLLRKRITQKFDGQKALIVQKIVLYGGTILISLTVLKELGFSLTTLLGAAGIAGVAIGFASQTSLSNVISGFFLMGEKPFVVGDVITVNDVTGEVLSIDTLSVKIRLFDNKYVRIPNETLLKSQVTTITKFPIRRVDTMVSVAYKEDLTRVKEILNGIASDNPLVLENPPALIIMQGFGSSSIDMLFVVWVQKTDFLAVKNAVFETIKKRFDEEGIEIPFPHLSIYKGSVTDPIPVSVDTSKGSSSQE